MLAKENRLTKNKEFEEAFRWDRGRSGRLINLKYFPNQKNPSRFGIIISKKLSKKATLRNKIKRRLRELLRLKLDRIKNGFDILVIARPEILDRSSREIDQELERLLKRADLLR